MFYMVGGAVQELLGLPSGGGTAYTEGGDYYQARALVGSDWSRINAADAEAKRFVRAHLAQIELLAARLQDRGEMSGAEVSALLSPAPVTRSVPALTTRSASTPAINELWACGPPRRRLGYVKQVTGGSWEAFDNQDRSYGIFATNSDACHAIPASRSSSSKGEKRDRDAGRPAARPPVEDDNDGLESRGYIPQIWNGYR